MIPSKGKVNLKLEFEGKKVEIEKPIFKEEEISDVINKMSIDVYRQFDKVRDDK